MKGKHTIVQVKCQWKDLNKSTSWIDLNALALQDPIPILEYINRKHLSNDRLFKWILVYCHNGDHPSHLARAFQSKV